MAGRGVRWWIAQVRGRVVVVDTVTALGLTVVGVLSARTAIDAGGLADEPPRTAVWVLLTGSLMLPLACRRTRPLGTLVAVTVAFFPYRLANVPDLSVSVVAWWLALYSAGAYGNRRWRDVVRAFNVVCTMGFVSYRLATPGGELVSGVFLARAGFLLLLNVLFMVSAWTFGDATAARRAGERTVARQAVALERVRIARELHDVVAHHVSVMGIQASAARRVMGRDDEAAQSALQSIERTSRTAIGELQRLLTFLRPHDASADVRHPHPTLHQLDQLATDVRATGLRVNVTRRGDLGRLPASVDVAAYRIVQEALTNAIKHARANTVTVRVDLTDDRLHLKIVDDGPVTPSRTTDHEDGHGIVGMRERVALHDGTIHTGHLPGGGFEVCAVLPVQTGPR